MNKYFFNRLYSLTIGYPLLPAKAKVISGLRIAFDISKTETPESNQATITINNLSDESRAFIKERSGSEAADGMTVTIRAGYEEMDGRENIPILFTGDIMGVSHDVTKPEIVTTLLCHDGLISIKKSAFSKSYKPGVRVAQIINDIVSAMGIPIQTKIESIGLPDYVYNNAYTFTGKASDALSRVCSGYGLRWSIQNNTIKIYRAWNEDGTPGHDGKAAVKGVMIGSPKRIAKSMSGVESTDFRGWEISALLMPQAEPGGRIQISSTQILNSPVTLQVAEVHHSGDTHGDEWKTTIKARETGK
jgi:hypothetical protein